MLYNYLVECVVKKLLSYKVNLNHYVQHRFGGKTVTFCAKF